MRRSRTGGVSLYMCIFSWDGEKDAVPEKVTDWRDSLGSLLVIHGEKDAAPENVTDWRESLGSLLVINC